MILARCEKPVRLQNLLRIARMPLAAAALFLCANGCGKQAAVSAPPAPAPESQVKVSASADAVVVDSAAAEFAIAPSGYVAASLLRGGGKNFLGGGAGGGGRARG